MNYMRHVFTLCSILLLLLATSSSASAQQQFSKPKQGIHAAVLSAKVKGPNPFWSSITINYEVNVPTAVSATLYNSLGKPVQAPLQAEYHTTGAYQMKISGQDLLPGLYFLRFRSSGKPVVLRMVKSYGSQLQ